MTPHKWAKEIHAFADGVVIEVLCTASGTWYVAPDPNWGSESGIFRVKPKIKLPILVHATERYIDAEEVFKYAIICYEAGYAAARKEMEI